MFLAPNLFHANYKMLQLPPNWHGRHGKGEITQRQHVYDECFSILGYTSGIIRVGKNQIGRIQYASFGAGVVDGFSLILANSTNLAPRDDLVRGPALS